MTWYIYKGEDLKRDQVIKFPFCRTFNRQYNQTDLVYFEELSFSEVDAAPTYPGSTVHTSCRVRVDLSGFNKIALDLKPRDGVDGRPYYDLNFHLVLSTAEANLKFSLEIKGREMSSVVATYA